MRDAVLKVVGDSGAGHRPRPLATAADWRLAVGGEVEKPSSLGLEQLTAIGRESRSLDITCVSAAKIADGRTVAFTGTPFAALAERVRPRAWSGSPDGASVRLSSRAPGTIGPRGERHHTYMRLADCLDPVHGLLLATELDGEPLPYPNGGPLRAVFGAAFFFYKSIKWLAEIEVVHLPLAECRGTWEEYAGYHVRARIAHGERFEPRMHRIAEARREADGTISDELEAVPETRWRAVFAELYERRDLSRLCAAQLHKIVRLPTDFTDCRFRDGAFHAKLRGTSFASADFTGADLGGCNFSLSKFSNARFSRDGERPATLAGCDLEGAFFNRAHLRGVSMAGARLSNTTFFGPHDFDRPTDRVEGLDVRGAVLLAPRTAEWLRRNGAIV